MAMYQYYAIFEPIDEGGYSVSFPDLENVYTDGETFAEAYDMAQDVLGTMLSFNEEENINFNPPSSPDKIIVPVGCSLVYVQVNTDDFREAV